MAGNSSASLLPIATPGAAARSSAASPTASASASSLQAGPADCERSSEPIVCPRALHFAAATAAAPAPPLPSMLRGEAERPDASLLWRAAASAAEAMDEKGRNVARQRRGSDAAATWQQRGSDVA